MNSLRQARINDHWNKVYKRKYPLTINKLQLSDGDIFGRLTLSLKPGINAIVGKNGVGKSNFIRTIYNSLITDESNRQRFHQLFDESKVEIEIEVSGEISKLNLSLSEEVTDNDILCLLFDPCTLIPEIQNLFLTQSNLDELLEVFNSSKLSNEDLKLVNFITNTEYSEVTITNIEDEYESFPSLPFFIVDRQGIKYDSRNMGLGELSLLYYYWIIDYIKKSKRNCLLIIEEPESFLPPLIQNRLCDTLAMTLSTKGISCLISTHSEHILRKIPRNHIKVMSRVSNQINFIDASLHFEHMDILGLNAPKKGVIFYEDKAAYLFSTSLIKLSSRFVSDSFLYHMSGSEGDVLIDLSRFPKSFPDFSFLAIFDGDCRGRLESQLTPHDNYIYLPSNLSPEEHLIAYLKGKDINIIANHIGCSNESLNAAIEVAAGLDHHDYFLKIANVLAISYEHLFKKLCDLWTCDVVNKKSVDEFLLDLESKIK